MQKGRAALYCRVGCGGSAEARRLALDLQRQALERFAEQEGLQACGCFLDDGAAGNDPDRPGLAALSEAYAAGAFDVVLVVKRDRLYRGGGWDAPHWPFPVYSLEWPEGRKGKR